MPSAYGLFVSAGAVTALIWLRRRLPRIGVSQNVFWAGIWAMLGGAIVGAKALFVVLGWEHYASGELRLTERVVTLGLLKDRIANVRRVVVSAKAVVTPAVQDELKARNVELVRG